MLRAGTRRQRLADRPCRATGERLGADQLVGGQRRGCSTRGYSRYRKRLLEGGVGLWELKSSIDENAEHHLMPSSRASLHAKAASIDDNGLFVGSYNLDPRSTSLNSEQGIFVRSEEVADAFNQQFDRVVTLREGDSQRVTVPIESSYGENRVAREIRDALRDQLDPELLHVERDDGEDVLVKKHHGEENFALRVISSTVSAVRIRVRKE